MTCVQNATKLNLAPNVCGAGIIQGWTRPDVKYFRGTMSSAKNKIRAPTQSIRFSIWLFWLWLWFDCGRPRLIFFHNLIADCGAQSRLWLQMAQSDCVRWDIESLESQWRCQSWVPEKYELNSKTNWVWILSQFAFECYFQCMLVWKPFLLEKSTDCGLWLLRDDCDCAIMIAQSFRNHYDYHRSTISDCATQSNHDCDLIVGQICCWSLIVIVPKSTIKSTDWLWFAKSDCLMPWIK